MACVLMTPPYLQFFDANGLPLAGGKIYSYVAGTVNTPKSTFTDASGTIQAANPIILDAAGRATVWITGSYKFLVTDANGVAQRDATDMVTSFNTIASAGSSYYQSFSGDGSTSAFTLSQDLGTDQNAILVFVDQGIPNMITNGDFSSDTVWTKGAGWFIGSGVATATTSSAAITQNAVTSTPIVAGQVYVLTYTITQSAGSIIPSVGGTNGTSRNAAGTYSETIIAGASQVLAFTGTGFTGTLDNVSLKSVMDVGNVFIPPTQFTLTSGVTPTITFAQAPKTGTNNINILAPATLAAAASASAAAAQSFANASNASATVAANQATSFVGTSTTSNVIGTGSVSFVTQANKNFLPGEFITVSSNSAPANFMYGQVSSYNSTTGVLVVAVSATGGSGTYTDWNIAVSGVQGASGGPVSNGTYGQVTVTGGGTVWTVRGGTTTQTGIVQLATTATVQAGTASNAVTETALRTGLLVSGNLTPTTSGTSSTQSGIPLWAKMVVVQLIGCSLSGTSNILIQLGPAAGPETTGYNYLSTFGGASAISQNTYAAGFGLPFLVAAATAYGTFTLTLADVATNLWVGNGGFTNFAGSTSTTMYGSKSLAGVLSQIRIISANGTDTFDGGSWNILYY